MPNKFKYDLFVPLDNKISPFQELDFSFNNILIVVLQVIKVNILI